MGGGARTLEEPAGMVGQVAFADRRRHRQGSKTTFAGWQMVRRVTIHCGSCPDRVACSHGRALNWAMSTQDERNNTGPGQGGGGSARSGGRPIELKIHDVGQLFQSLDPLPYRERDLDAAVEEYVVAWARERGGAAPIRIVVHLPAGEMRREEAGHIADAIRNYFDYRAEVVGWELNEMFRIGRVSLIIGLVVLGLCVALGTEVSRRVGGGYAGRFFDEGLIILGWVANWRPVQIFLYDWWPLFRARRLYQRLARATVELKPAET